MAFVMVPVPVEVVDEFNRYLLGLTLMGSGTTPSETWLAARDSLDAPHRAFLDVVARHSVEDEPLNHAALSAATGIERSEVLRFAMEINRTFETAGAVPCVITEPKVTVLPDGVEHVEPVVNMPYAIARLMLQ